MKMKTLTLSIPDSINEIDVRMQLAAQLFEKGIMSSGQAADLAGITKRDFLENVGQYGVSIFGENIEDLDRIINE
jgi:predicted HTH domain antitoxin